MDRSYPKSGDDVITSENQYTDEEREFLMAVEAYKKQTKRRFPTWVEILKVAHSLGYRKVEEEIELPGFKRGPNTHPHGTHIGWGGNGKSIRTEPGEESPTREIKDSTTE